MRQKDFDCQTDVYENLRRHLDRQPMGFPATRSGAEIKILKHIFTPEQARVAACLTHRAETLGTIFERARDFLSSKAKLKVVLDDIVTKGGIEKGGTRGRFWYRNAPLVVGMYEYQLGRLDKNFIEDFAEYTSSSQYGLSFLSTHLPQMRTIPIGKSINVDTQPMDFDSITNIIEASRGPFAACECICRKKQGILGNTCQVTDREQTCLAIGHLARTAADINIGVEITKKQAIDILAENQDEGLVLQPSNSREVDFICSCCGCCCGMLRIHKNLPRPLNFWASNFVARIEPDDCNACGLCADRCQVDAISGVRKKDSFEVDPNICIGCGVCVAACRTRAVTLDKTADQTVPPRTREELFEIIDAKKKGRLSKLLLTGNLVKDALLTGRRRILKSG